MFPGGIYGLAGCCPGFAKGSAEASKDSIRQLAWAKRSGEAWWWIAPSRPLRVGAAGCFTAGDGHGG